MRRLIDRRDFLRGAGAAFAASLSPRALHAATSADAVFAMGFQRRGGPYGVAVLSERGDLISAVDLPDRGHDVTFDNVSRRSVVFGRQPGNFALVFDHGGRSEPVTIPAASGRHFFGHGVFSPDGALLYATENDFDNAAGVIGFYDARDGFRRLGEFPTYGIGPHEMLLMPDGKTLAVANGGIETHPDFGSAKLNIPTMEPSLVFIDRGSGSLIEKHALPRALHQLSIRHMDADERGRIWFGCQYEGPAGDMPLLVGWAEPGTGMQLLDMKPDVLGSLRNYVGSVAANREAGLVAVSSPQGNCLAVIDTAAGKIVETRRLVEVCGIAADGTGFMATTGAGAIHRPDGAAPPVPDHYWDNHILRIG